MHSLISRLATILVVVYFSITQLSAITIVGTTEYADLDRGPETGFMLGDVANFRVVLNEAAVISFTYNAATSSTLGNFSGNLIQELEVTVLRGGSEIHSILFQEPDEWTVASLLTYRHAFQEATRDMFNIGINDDLPTMNQHLLSFISISFQGANIMTFRPVAGESYTLGELIGDGSGIANSSPTVSYAEFVDGEPGQPGYLNQWDFQGTSAMIVPEPGGMLFVMLAGLLGAVRRRR